MSETMVERVAKAIDAVQIWSRFNDWTSDRVEGFPIEICRYGRDGEDEIVVLKRFPATISEDAAVREVVSEMRARAAIEAMREPTDSMADIAQEKYCGQPRETAVAWAKEDKWDAHRQDLIDEYQVFIDAALATPPAEG